MENGIVSNSEKKDRSASSCYNEQHVKDSYISLNFKHESANISNSEGDFEVMEDFKKKIMERKIKPDRFERLNKMLHASPMPFSEEIDDHWTLKTNFQILTTPVNDKIDGANVPKIQRINTVNHSLTEQSRICGSCRTSVHKTVALICFCCRLSYHPKCVNLTDNIVSAIEIFVCEACSVQNSEFKTVYKLGMNPKYCICKSSDEDRFMIGCDNCDEWYHGDCIKISEIRASHIEKFYCKKCKVKNPSLEIVYKQDEYHTGAISFNYQNEKY